MVLMDVASATSSSSCALLSEGAGSRASRSPPAIRCVVGGDRRVHRRGQPSAERRRHGRGESDGDRSEEHEPSEGGSEERFDLIRQQERPLSSGLPGVRAKRSGEQEGALRSDHLAVAQPGAVEVGGGQRRRDVAGDRTIVAEADFDDPAQIEGSLDPVDDLFAAALFLPAAPAPRWSACR